MCWEKLRSLKFEQLEPVRLLFAMAYLLSAFYIYKNYLSLINNGVPTFILDIKNADQHWARFLWCIVCSLVGFSLILFQIGFRRKAIEKESGKILNVAFRSYISHHLFVLIVIASLGFSLSSMLTANFTHGYLFYYLSFSICTILSYLNDQFFGIFVSIFSIFSNRR